MKQRQDYRQVPKFNLISVEYKRPPVNYRQLLFRLLLIVVIVVELVYIWNLSQERYTLESNIESVQWEIQQIQENAEIELAAVDAKKEEANVLDEEITALDEESTALDEKATALDVKSTNLDEEAEKLQDAITALKKEQQAEQQALEDDWRYVSTNRANWSKAVADLFWFRPEGVELSAVERDGTQMNIVGTATDYDTLHQYRRLLLYSSVISQIVSLESETTESDNTTTIVPFNLVVDVRMGGS